LRGREAASSTPNKTGRTNLIDCQCFACPKFPRVRLRTREKFGGGPLYRDGSLTHSGIILDVLCVGGVMGWSFFGLVVDAPVWWEPISRWFLEIWNLSSEIVSNYYKWFEEIVRVLAPYFTMAAGGYAIYTKMYYAERRLPLLLQEFLAREEARLERQRQELDRIVERPGPGRPFQSPLFVGDALEPALQQMRWGKLSEADNNLEASLLQLQQQLDLWQAKRRDYEKHKIEALLLKGAIAASRAGRLRASGDDDRPENVKALGYFEAAHQLDEHDLDALEYMAHQRVRLGAHPRALDDFKLLEQAAKKQNKPLVAARALKFQAEVHERQNRPNLGAAKDLLAQAENALPLDASFVEKAEIVEMQGRVRAQLKKHRPSAPNSYITAELLYRNVQTAEAQAGAQRCKDALARLQTSQAANVNGRRSLASRVIAALRELRRK
jgi:hypothetical protein